MRSTPKMESDTKMTYDVAPVHAIVASMKTDAAASDWPVDPG